MSLVQNTAVGLGPWPSSSSAAAAPARARIATCGLDRTWLASDVQGSLFEIAGGRIAQSRGASASVKQLAAALIRDHSRSLTESGRFLRRLGLKVPGTPDAVQHWQLHMVTQESGAAFDRDYAWLEVSDHVVDIQNARDEAQNGCNATVRGMARRELPVLQRHLRLATAAQRGSRV